MAGIISLWPLSIYKVLLELVVKSIALSIVSMVVKLGRHQKFISTAYNEYFQGNKINIVRYVKHNMMVFNRARSILILF